MVILTMGKIVDNRGFFLGGGDGVVEGLPAFLAYVCLFIWSFSPRPAFRYHGMASWSHRHPV